MTLPPPGVLIGGERNDQAGGTGYGLTQGLLRCLQVWRRIAAYKAGTPFWSENIITALQGRWGGVFLFPDIVTQLPGGQVRIRAVHGAAEFNGGRREVNPGWQRLDDEFRQSPEKRFILA